MIKNRLEKNYKKLKGWAKQAGIEAFRIYDRDIPEYPFIVDIYGDFLLVYDRTDAVVDAGKNHLEQVFTALKEIFPEKKDKVILKKRERQEGLNQYEKIDTKDNVFIIQESKAKFYVNLHDYLDTGLFLDHRPMRSEIYKQASGKTLLNLFCYTASVSVFAALGGAKTTSVDMSKTYIQWAKKNFELNGLDPEAHQFVEENVLEFLKNHIIRYDLIFLDPPTFSNSKKMSDHFEVEKDQDFLVDRCMTLLKPGGVLYFSTNKRKFKLSEHILKKYRVDDISERSIPPDFHDKKIHKCFKLSL